MQTPRFDESVNRCRNRHIRHMWLSMQSEYETEPVRVVTVNKPNSSVDQSEELLKKIIGSADSNGFPSGEGSRIITDG